MANLGAREGSLGVREMTSQDVLEMAGRSALVTNHQMKVLQGGRQRVLQGVLVDLGMILRIEIVPIVRIVTQRLRRRQLSHRYTQLTIQMNRMTSQDALDTKGRDVREMPSQSAQETTSPDVLVMKSQVVLGMTSQDAPVISQDVPVMKDLVGLVTNHQMTDLRGGRQRVLQDALVDLVMILQTEIVLIARINTPQEQQGQL